jgi:hypothetical protein
VIAEESYFSDSAAYTSNLTLVGFKQSTGVNTPSLNIGAGYWSATVTHTQLVGISCGIAVNTTNPVVSTAGEGEPACK